MVYKPAEDSFLLEKEIKNYLGDLKRKRRIDILDMGSGSGIQAQACIKSGADKTRVWCADIDEKAIKRLEGQGLKTIQTDLFANIKKQTRFDLIIFNAPYLPEDKEEKKYDKCLDTTAGEQGYEIILKFLEQARIHLNKWGKILLLFSSLSKPEIILSYAKKLGYSYKKLAEEKLFFEKLFVYKLE